MIRCLDQFYPVIVTLWHGPFTGEAIDAYFVEQRKLAERAEREGVWLASIAPEGDTPSSSDRKRIAERTREMPARLRDRTIASFAIVDSPLKRGALTALGWLISDLARIEAVSSEAEAIDGVRRALEAKGVEVPRSLTVESLVRAVDESSRAAGRAV